MQAVERATGIGAISSHLSAINIIAPGITDVFKDPDKFFSFCDAIRTEYDRLVQMNAVNAETTSVIALGTRGNNRTNGNGEIVSSETTPASEIALSNN